MSKENLTVTLDEETSEIFRELAPNEEEAKKLVIGAAQYALINKGFAKISEEALNGLKEMGVDEETLKELEG